MRNRVLYFIATLLFLIAPAQLAAQSNFDINAYKQFLAANKDLSGAGLRSLYPAGIFNRQAVTSYTTAAYFDSISKYYPLTPDEKTLLGKHGFVVTERIRPASFGSAFLDIYQYDLPVFVSTDAILHALHMSYDAILVDVEKTKLIPKLDFLLSTLHNQLPVLSARYSAEPRLKRMLLDLDIYLTIPRILRGSITQPYFSENAAAVQSLLQAVNNLRPLNVKLFSETPRMIDFSQFTPRGHYTQSEELTAYFKAMIWLGRTEIYLIPPKSIDPPPSFADMQRQIILAALLDEAAVEGNAYPLLNEIEAIIKFFVGDQDNTTLPNIRTLITEGNISSPLVLLDSIRCVSFQDSLAVKAFVFQRINSQILMSDAGNPDQIRPAAALMLLGQRFVIDSYVTGNVVFDKIIYQEKKVLRMLPSSMDILFAIGNDAAAQILIPELEEYHYASNLSGLRYLIDSYEPQFWESTLYNGWLSSIRALNPPRDRSALPPFMQTAAWWQEKMNTQLASWAQLRHDNLLYAKQSYTGGTVCSFPESYVEPIPQFYKAVKRFAETAESRFKQPDFDNTKIVNYFSFMKSVADTLGTIAEKELNGIALTTIEKNFLHAMFFTQPICGIQYDGWYFKLFYTREEGMLKKDLVVADVHTAPTDAAGNFVGWVMHGGTGPLNMAVIVTDLPGGGSTAFIGPVLSYYEHISENFKRLTDDEWKTMYAVLPSLRPSFVNLYLADSLGNMRSEGLSLLTGINDKSQPEIPTTVLISQNFPNPFNNSTIISFSIPEQLSHSVTDLSVYSLQGQLVRRLVQSSLPAGNYLVRWDGKADNGNPVSSSVYFYTLTVGNHRQTGKMNLMK
jgi:hypothetical protein